MISSEVGESGQAIRAPARPLAHSSIHRMKLHVVTKVKRFFSVMARIASEPNGGLLKIALGICAGFFAIIVAMLSFWMNHQAGVIEDVRTGQVTNGNRLTAIETRIGRIEDDIGKISD